MKSGLVNRLREFRDSRGWSQQQLADAAGIARASVSAIEAGRLTPSTAAALGLAAALNCRVEDLFTLSSAPAPGVEWAWRGAAGRVRYWQAEVAGRRLLYPCESALQRSLAHDGVAEGRTLDPRVDRSPPTLVMACCDPAVGLLAAEMAQSAGVRLLTYFRSSRRALELLRQGLVHVAGLHLGHGGSESNQEIVASTIGDGYQLVRVASWEEGVVTSTGRRESSAASLVRSKPRWVGREAGSGARQCLDELVGKRTTIRRMASDHYGVVEAVRSGWADAGVAVRLVAEEAELRFLPVRVEAYDLCFSEPSAGDPRVQALLAALRSVRYRRLLGDLPGYNAAETGTIIG